VSSCKISFFHSCRHAFYLLSSCCLKVKRRSRIKGREKERDYDVEKKDHAIQCRWCCGFSDFRGMQCAKFIARAEFSEFAYTRRTWVLVIFVSGINLLLQSCTDFIVQIFENDALLSQKDKASTASLSTLISAICFYSTLISWEALIDNNLQ